MKKLIKIGAVLLVLFIIAVVAAIFSLGSIIKTGVETVGPKVAKVDVKLDGARVSPLSGGGGLTGLLIGNPDGFKSSAAIKVGDVSVSVNPASVLSPKVVVRSVNVKEPEITLEGSLKGNNLSKILANINEFTAGEKKGGTADAKESKGAGKKLQVDEFVITGGKINLALTELGGKPATIPLPEIRLSGLGQGTDGITAGELAEKVISAVLDGSTKAAAGSLGELAKAAVGKATGLGKDGANAVKDATKGIGNLFKK